MHEESGLPQEAVDALREQHDKSVAMQRCSCTFGARCDMARILDALAAERAKGAGLREATIRECIKALRAGDAVEWALDSVDYGVELLRALLPAVSEGAPTPAPCPNCNDTGIVEWHADSFGNLDSAPCDCPAAVVQPNVTPATTCPGCGKRPCVCTTVVLG